MKLLNWATIKLEDTNVLNKVSFLFGDKYCDILESAGSF